MKSKLGLALAINCEEFKDRTDRGGVPYALHGIYVMEHTDGDDCVKCAALMHDLIEDTDYTFQDLVLTGFSAKTIKILRYV